MLCVQEKMGARQSKGMLLNASSRGEAGVFGTDSDLWRINRLENELSLKKGAGTVEAMCSILQGCFTA